jgi:predicted nucleotidyltransferase
MTRDEEIRTMLRELFQRHADRLSEHRVVLFGSRARGDARPRSDYDLGVVGKKPLPLEDFFALEDELDGLPTLYQFDWVDLARTSDAFRSSALNHVKVIYEA